MKMMRLFGLIVAFGMTLSGLAMAAPLEIPMPNNRFQFTVTGDNSSGIVIAMIPVNVGGKIAICGAIWPEGARREALARRKEILKITVIEIRGKQVRGQFGIFPVYDSAEAATTARCTVSQSPWQGPYGNDDVLIRLSTDSIRG